MCGISGIVVLRKGAEVPTLALQSMTQAMEHRGPDAGGYWQSVDRKCGLGHRRLSIVDLSAAGVQPMTSRSGGATVTFNGEIYNFQELRVDLERKGHVFSSHSDTEVLVNLYVEYGEAMLDRMEGDFAFAIWDERRQKLFMARDRAGVKPFYYAITPDYFIFASELRALLASGLVERQVDDKALYHYMTYLVTPPGMTMVKGVQKLEIATCMTLDLSGNLSKRLYWDALPQTCDGSSADLDAEFATLFDDAVRKRTMSDVPVGVLFSGGVDSTLNAGSFGQAIAPRPVDTFTVGMPGTANDESIHARHMAKILGTRHHEVLISDQDVQDALGDIAFYQDEPLSDPVCLPLWFVSKLARAEGVTVLQAGEGADELFCGYSAYMRYIKSHQRMWRPLSQLPRSVPRMAGGVGYRMARGNAALAAVSDALLRMGNDEEFFMSSAIGYYGGEKTASISGDFAHRMQGVSAFDVVRPLYDRLAKLAPKASFLQKMTYIDLHVRLPELLLMRVDKMSMAHSLEVRVPFLDHRLVEFSMRVPDAWKLRHGVPKEPVKNLATRFAPRDEIYRPKKGFGAPLQQWFKGGMGETARDLLTSSSSGADQWFNVAKIVNGLDQGYSASRPAFQLWVVYNFLLWKNLVLDRP
jgi:asparagine synthase (glutamine-hydrolysing)